MTQPIYIFPVKNVFKQIKAAFILLFFTTGAVSAQENPPQLYKEIVLQKKSYSFHELTREMQQQSGCTFSYNASKISSGKKIKPRSERLTVREILNIINRQASIGYKITGQGHIVYQPPAPVTVAQRRKEKKETKAEQKPARKKEKSNQQKPETIAAVPASARDSAQHIIVIGDSALATTYYNSSSGYGGAFPGNSNGRYSFVLHYDKGSWHDPYLQLDGTLYTDRQYYEPKIWSLIKRNTLIDIGVSADETYYLNPQIHLGFGFLYGILSYHIGKYSHWQYGLGSSADIGGSWSIGASFTTGAPAPVRFDALTIDTIPGKPPVDSFRRPHHPLIWNAVLPLKSTHA